MSRRLLPLRRLAAAAALLLAGCECCNLPDSPMDAQEKAKDEEAAQAYYLDAAKTYYEGGKYEKSVQMWEKVLAKTPDDPWAKFGLAGALHRQGTLESLKRSGAILKEQVKTPLMHQKDGDVSHRVWSTYASVLSDLADYWDRGVRRADEQLKEERNPAASGELKVKKQENIARRNALLQESIPWWEKVLTRSKEDPYALAGLSKAHLLLGDDLRGIDYGRRYVALSRRSQQNYARSLKEWNELVGKKGVTKEQRDIYTSRILGARDKEKGMTLMLASVYMRREEYADAVEAYDHVIELDPAAAPAFIERAQAYARLKHYDLAIKDVEEYLKLTDPVKQRNSRLDAAELLDRYRKMEARSGSAPMDVPAGAPATGRLPAVPAEPPPAGYAIPAHGSPDGR